MQAARPILAFVLGSLLCQCSVVTSTLQPTKVIYALPNEDELPSPLARSLPPVGKAITFGRDAYTLPPREQRNMTQLAQELIAKKMKVMILGFAQRGLPPSYARSLSQRRADAVRQALIEAGADADSLHPVGYGHDQPSLGNTDSVKLVLIEP
jgi:outer membrane protein OmpA-like peptidoglycan-associated protein